MSEFLQQLVNGLSLGAIYALIALGYTMVYGVLRFINFAHSDVFMVGAFAGYYIGKLLGGEFTHIAAMPWPVAAVAGAIIGLGVGRRFIANTRPSKMLLGIVTAGLSCVGFIALNHILPSASARVLPFMVIKNLLVRGFVTLIFSMLLCAVLGVVIERSAYRPLRDHSKLNVLITAIGVSLLLENTGQFFFGAAPKAFPVLFPAKSFTFMGGLV